MKKKDEKFHSVVISDIESQRLDLDNLHFLMKKNCSKLDDPKIKIMLNRKHINYNEIDRIVELTLFKNIKL